MIKKFNSILTVNYKTGEFRVYKKKPKNLKPTEIPINFELEIEIPEMPQVEAKGIIKLSDEKITRIVMEEI